MSALFLGRALAELLPSARLARLLLYSHASLAALLLAVGLSSRFAVLLLACVGVGFFKDWSASSRISLTHAKENPGSKSADARRSLLGSSFAMIIVGFLYRENARLPALYPCALCGLCFLAVALRSSRAQPAQRKTKFSALSHHSSEPPPASDKLAGKPVLLSDVPEAAVPQRYVAMWGSLAAAHARFVATLNWRRANGMDDLLSHPQPFFAEVLQFYPHAIHGRSLDGCAVLYEVLGKVRTAELSKRGASATDILWHMLLRNEFVFQRVLGPEGCIMTVVDVKDVRVADISVDVISFLKQSTEVMDLHYPNRVRRLVICNAPYWFSSVWGMVASILPESVRRKISIIADVRGLDAFIAPEERPAQYGGTGVDLGCSPEHLQFLALPQGWGSEAPVRSDRSDRSEARSEARSEDAREEGGRAGWLEPLMGRRGAQSQAYLGEKN